MNESVKIAGLQKLTLLDYPGKMAAILFLPGCNMQCPFCQNSELIHNSVTLMDYTSVFEFLAKRSHLLDGVVITGGEPTLQDITPLCEDLHSLGYDIKLDTNGLRPDRIQQLIDYHLIDYIAMDIKNSLNKYDKTCGVHVDANAITASIDAIMHCSLPYEFRTTVSPSLHDINSIISIGEDLIYGAEHYYLQPFAMSDTVPDINLEEPSDTLLVQMKAAAQPYVHDVQIRGRDL